MIIKKNQTASATAILRPIFGEGSLKLSIQWDDPDLKIKSPEVTLILRDELEANEIKNSTLAVGDSKVSAMGTVEGLTTG